MTTTRYIFARLAMAFGINRRQHRMAEAAAETHLLREAEQILGERIWENVEEVEELGIEYWNLRRLHVERERLRKELAKSENTLSIAHEQRAAFLNQRSGDENTVEEERKQLLNQLEELARKRDVVVSKAREVRRLYDGLKTKLDVLKEESREDVAVIEKTQNRMAELRSTFEELKSSRDRIAQEIKHHDGELDRLDERLDSDRKKHREDAAEAFQLIGVANKEISEYQSELGLIDSRMHQLFSEIGRHISRNAATDPECRTASRNQRSMVDVMQQLRKSIALNHRLTGN